MVYGARLPLVGKVGRAFGWLFRLAWRRMLLRSDHYLWHGFLDLMAVLILKAGRRRLPRYRNIFTVFIALPTA